MDAARLFDNPIIFGGMKEGALVENVSKVKITEYVVSSVPVWVSIAIVAVIVVTVVAIVLYRKKHKK
jgi:hypothetical protein